MKLDSLFLNRRSARIVILSGAYIGAWVTLWHISKVLNIFSGVSLWYPPAGMTFAILLGFSWRAAPLPFIASLLAGLSLWSWQHWPYYLMANASPVIIYGIAAQVLSRYFEGSWNFNRPKYVAAFFSAAVSASLLTAVSGTTILISANFFTADHIFSATVGWWIGDLIGLVTVTPILLYFVIPMAKRFIAKFVITPSETVRYRRGGTGDPLIIGLQIIASFGALALAFWLPLLTHSSHGHPFAYLFLLFPLAWIVNTGGVRSAIVAILLYEIGMVSTLAFSETVHTALEYQIVMIALAATGLLMASLVQERSASLNLYRDLAQISNDLLWEFGRNGRLASINGNLVEKLLSKDLIGTGWRHYISIEDSTDFEQLLATIRQRKPFQNVMLCLQLPNQNSIWTSNSGLPIFDEQGGFNGYRGTTTDISDLKKAETLIHEYNKTLTNQVAERTEALKKSHDKLLVSEKRFRALSAAAPVGISEADLHCRCIFVNQHWCELTGLSHHKALDIHLIDIVHPEDRAWVAARWDNWAAIRQQEISRLASHTLAMEYRIQRPDDRLIWVLGNSVVLRDSANNIIGYINTITDITETKKKEEQTWKLANYDKITGLPNRNLFFDRLEQIVRSTERTQDQVALLLMDLDGFKEVNDTFGHAMGDELLRQVGQRLTERLRASDVAARIGGDEFTVILSNITDIDAAKVAIKIVSALAQPFQLNGGAVAIISASVGIAIYPKHTTNINKLVKMADSAMYTAKRSGKNAFRFYEESMPEANL